MNRRAITTVIELLERRRLLVAGAGPTTAAAIDDLVAPGDALVGVAVQVGPTSSYFFARDAAGTTASLWRTDGTPAGTGPTDMSFEVPEGTRDPEPLLAFDDRLLFAAADATAGNELWLTDGTAAGTRVVSNFADPAANPSDTVIAGGLVFFTVADAETGRELWRTDGTTAGTRRVEDIRPGPIGSSPFWLTPMNGRLYFAANDGVSGPELWSSDGTEAGTNLVVDLVPGSGGAAPTALYADGGRLFFASTTDELGAEPWTSDGTAAGTRLIEDVNPGPLGSSPRGFISYDGAVYFNAFEPATGTELWRTNGTPPGTELVTELVPGDEDIEFTGAVVAGGKLYLGASYGRWSGMVVATDGTAGGTQRIYDEPDSVHRGVFGLRAMGDRVAFVTTTNVFEQELWVTDGSKNGTRPIRDEGPGLRGPAPSRMSLLPNGQLYFAATDVSAGSGPWVTDGSVAGTKRLAHVPVTPVPAEHIHRLVGVGDWVYAVGMYKSAYSGVVYALWVTNGRTGGTRMLTTDVGLILGAAPDGRLFFNKGAHLWITDGTPGGTVELPARPIGADFYSAIVGDTLYFVQEKGPNATELWKTDGTTAGTVRVRSFSGPSDIQHVMYLQPLGTDRVVFFAWQDGIGFEPWVSEGTESGTQLLKDVYPGPGSSGIGTTYSNFTSTFSAGDQVYFIVSDGTHHHGLWATDGTPEGTRLVKDLVPGALFRYETKFVKWAATGSTVYFTAHGPPHYSGVTLWRTDGTEAGAVSLADRFSHWPQGLAVYGGKVFLASGTGSTTGELTMRNTLYVGDGTPGSFRPVRTFDGHSESSPANLVAGHDGVYFVANDGTHGREPWYSDGTPEGTHLVFEAVPGPGEASEVQIVPHGDAVFFNTRERAYVSPAQGAPDAPGITAGIAAEYVLEGSGGERTLTVTKGHVIVLEDAHALYPGLEVVVVDGARVTFTSSHRLDRLQVNGSASVAGTGIVVSMKDLDVAAGGVLDLGTNSLVIDYEPGTSAYAAVSELIGSGRMAGPNGGGTVGLAVAEAADVLGLSPGETASWNGVTVDATTVLVKHTYDGDANLDGRINADDYFRIDSGFLAWPPQSGYSDGDFNYDGKINADDYFLIDSAFLGQASAAPVATAPPMVAAASVPVEPRRKVARRPQRADALLR